MSDKGDYNPGTTVVLTGGNWQPGESVHVFVNDDAGQTWSHSADVIADDAGGIGDSFQLPNWFVADYSVTATGATSGTATTSFTDAQVTISPQTATATVGNSRTYTATGQNCTLTGYSWTAAGQGPTPGTVTPASGSGSSFTVTFTGAGTVRIALDASGTNPSNGNACNGNDHVDVVVAAAGDTTPPDTSITAKPSNPSNGNAPSFSFTGSDNVTPAGSLTFECSLDGAAFASCTSPKSYASVADGSHTFQVRAKDAAGNVDPSPASYTWTIDTTAPQITLFSRTPANGAGWNKTDVSLVWNCSDPGGSGVVSASDGKTVSTEGANQSATGTCTDNAGNSASSTVTGINIDKTAPINVATTLNRAPDSNGWYTSAVGWTTTGNDFGSGIASCSTGTYNGPEGTGLTVSGTCTDVAGNESVTAASAPFKYDTTGPSAALSVTAGTAGAHGWYTSDVTVQTSGADSISGPVDCTADQRQTTETTGQLFNGTCTNQAGLVGHADPLTIKLDKTGPSASLSASGTLGDNGWYTSDVTVSTNGTDSISGPVDCTPDQHQTTDTSGAVFNGSCTNDAGLTTNASPLTVERDATAPVITRHTAADDCSVPGNSGWCRGVQTAGFTATDATSGFAPSGDPSYDFTKQTSTNGSAVSIPSGTVKDLAGNEGSSIDAGPFKIDSVAPGIVRNVAADSCDTPGDNGWCRGEQTAGFTASDATSGLASDGAASRDFTQSTTTNGSNVSIPSGAVSDVAGNTNSGIDATGFKIDSVAPGGVATSLDRGADHNGWYNHAVAWHTSGTDATSGIASCSSGTYSGPDGTGLTVSGKCKDNAGNESGTAASAAFKYDSTPPADVATVLDRAPDHNGWYNHAVAWHTSGTDATSGIASCSSGTYSGPDGTGLTVSGKCTDDAGNDSASVASAAFEYDATAPTNIAFQGIAAQTYAIADLPGPGSIGCSAQDATSGPPSCVVTGYDNTFGSHTLTATATDGAGNQSTAQLTYVVGLKSGDILQPILTSNNSQTSCLATNLQAFKIRSVIPVKFQLYLDAAKTQLMTTPPAGSVAKLTMFSCDKTTETTDPVADFVSAGAANTDNVFRWTGSPDYQYIYNLATAGKAAGTYGVQLTLYASNGTTVLAQSAKQFFVLRT